MAKKTPTSASGKDGKRGGAVSSLEIAYLPVDGLIPYARNSRTHSDEQIAQIAGSIKEFGFTNPVLIDEEGGIIAGHGRVLAATRLKLDTVPTIMLRGLSEAQRRAYVIADNKLALNAGWDDEMLAVELGDLRDMEFDLSLLGFDEQELADLIGDGGGGTGSGEGESGALIRGLQLAWPSASFNSVRVGSEPKVGRAKLWIAPEKYEQPAKNPPPYPSCDNYDAKVWQFARVRAGDNALIWNVGA